LKHSDEEFHRAAVSRYHDVGSDRFKQQQISQQTNLLLPIAIRNAPAAKSTTILTQPRASFRAGSSIEEVVGCERRRPRRRCFSQLQDPMFVVRSGGLIESAHAQPVLA
jgi:hypothetical protein